VWRKNQDPVNAGKTTKEGEEKKNRFRKRVKGIPKPFVKERGGKEDSGVQKPDFHILGVKGGGQWERKPFKGTGRGEM